MDVRPLKVNKDIFKFEARVFSLYDNMPPRHRHTLQEVLLKSTIEMRHHCNLASRLNKSSVKEKAQMFSLALGYYTEYKTKKRNH